MIEIQVCEFIDGSHLGKMERGTFHVEVRFIPSPGAHSICFRGERHHDRAKAEADKAYVESVMKRSMLKKPKPLKERTRTKRVKSGRR
jgi:hypothetical protein